METVMSLSERLYADYFMPSRLEEYENLLSISVQSGYAHYTLSEYFNLIVTGSDPGKCFIHRHDIDTDVRTARLMWEIEQHHKVKTSYYFRLNTLDFQLMKDIHKSGSEVGYHYEELAQYCKDKKITNPEKVREHYPEIAERFLQNFKMFSDRFGYKVNSVASHGDFVNRKLGIANHDFMTRELMDQCGIQFECYDARLLNSFNCIMSDMIYPKHYRPISPFEALKQNHKVLYLLTHPRHWRVAPLENTADNIRRVWEGLLYR
jgi:hypothetical protein